MAEPQTLKDQLRQDVLALLGGGMQDLEIDNDSITTAINLAFRRYRQRSSNAVEEAYSFITVEAGINEYILPSETIEVRSVLRRRMGTGGGIGASGGAQFDPFDIAFTNLYLLQAGSSGGLLTFNLYNQYLNTAAVMFGANVDFIWNTVSKKLQIVRNPEATEEMMLRIYKYIDDESILANTYSNMWIVDASLAYAKKMIGEAREMYSSLAGPQGGITLNGTQMKAEAEAILKELDEQIRLMVDGSTPLGVIKG